MCGIAGLVLAKPARAKGWLLGMAESLTHRGPDDKGYLVWDGVDVKGARQIPDIPFRLGLMHRRLAILREGIPSDRIHLVGDVMYDAALYYGEKAELLWGES